ncbi:MAG: hypothetical protein GAK28_00700 [Luteibacter sp.]|uniref:phage virion morphogenesis protein n=1 Tax=Luteibacter sp. TaxID=1886636 RepID=UPI00137DD306|nr:phage virion morphogenesis protein [Luteibacter sp.]KAF1009067.1 MAG: hypothetical protein GAK28_00700 [Luteibacter sp.]
MAGAHFTLDLQAQQAIDALASLARQLAPEGQTLLLQDIGEYLMRATPARAARQVSPDGIPWAPLKPRYAKAKAKVRPGVAMLRFDNHMLGDQLSSQVEGDTLYHGTNAPYGALQQFGGDVTHAARPTSLYFHHKDGEVSPQFVNRRKANFVQAATVPEHTVTIPARPWLGVDAEDEAEIVQLTLDHLTQDFPNAST